MDPQGFFTEYYAKNVVAEKVAENTIARVSEYNAAKNKKKE